MKNFFLKERNIVIAILLNAFLIFLISFPKYSDSQALHLLDVLFILFFVVEAIIKISTHGWKGYWANHANRFDLAIVLISLPSIVSLFIPFPDTSLFLTLRLFRVLRLMRYLTIIPNIRMLITGVLRALKASLFLFILFGLAVFLLAIFSCQIYGPIVPDLFGDPLISSYTIFQLFTIEGWNEIPKEIANNTDNLWLIRGTRVYFVIVVLVGGILGVSIANAVFLDEMMLDNNDKLEAKVDQLQVEIRELKELMKQSK